MKWEKKGLLFDLAKIKSVERCFEFAQSPQTLVFNDFVRIYFSTRKKDPKNGKYLSHIAFIDVDKAMKEILRISDHTVIELGGLGCFDEHGIFPINILQHNNKIFAYTCGWSRRISVSVETGIGLAESLDNGLTFMKIGNGPVMSSCLNEPVLVGDAFVRHFNNHFHMWYIYGTKWVTATKTEPPARVYKIAHATSINGLDWERDGETIIEDTLNADECQALPTVIKIRSRFHMYFCYRHASDFRKNSDRGYRLGYAYSDNLVSWTRDDKNSGIELSESGWDSQMMCYPHIFEYNGRVYLLYNGNEFGKYGFGLAELQH